MDACTIVTVNYGTMLVDNARASMLAAAERWACEFYEIVGPWPGSPTMHPSYRKLDVFDETDADRVLILDADAIISERCPNPFDELPDNALVGVGLTRRVDPKGAIIAYANLEWNSLMQTPGLSVLPFPGSDYINAGVMLVSRAWHAKLFDNVRSLCAKIDPLTWWEQTPLNYGLVANGISVELVPERWNYMQPQLLGDGWQVLYQQDVWIMHLAGRPEASEWMPTIAWQAPQGETHD